MRSAVNLLSFVCCLQALSKAALADKEEWVGVMARAVGAFDGRLDLDAVTASFSTVSWFHTAAPTKERGHAGTPHRLQR